MTVTLHEDQYTFLIISHSFHLSMRDVSDKFVEKNKHFFFNLAIYEVMQKTTVEPGRPQMTIWCMCLACWIPKVTNTQNV